MVWDAVKGCIKDNAAPVPGYAEDVQKIFIQHCVPCHGFFDFGGHRIAAEYEDAFKPSTYCGPDVTKGECAIVRILDQTMPQGAGGTVPKDQIDIIQAWIDGGMQP